MGVYVPWLLVVVLAAVLIYLLLGRRRGLAPMQGTPPTEPPPTGRATDGSQVIRVTLDRSGRATVPAVDGDVVIWQVADPETMRVSFSLNVRDPLTGLPVAEQVTLNAANPEQCTEPIGGIQTITVTVYDKSSDNTTQCRGCLILGGP